MLRKIFDPKNDDVSGQTWNFMGYIGLLML
jgi:hypothetical protein